jgi:hypothetical protein
MGLKESNVDCKEGKDCGERNDERKEATERSMKRGRATEVGEIREESKLGTGGREAGQLD